ncbi:MAG TPA: choice-of-anchor D domain-containing protein, partial [Opitutus sp.]|nr:choice-of-anchor D domain-containing protein [Opitutus sp.]
MKSSLVSAPRGRPGSCLLAGLLFLALPAVSVLAQNYTQNFGTAVTPAPTGWTIVGGTWNVSGGTFNHTSNQFREKAIYSTTNWTSNYTYKARVWVTSGGSSGNIAGIIFNYQGPRAYYDVTINNIGDVILSTINSPSADDVATPIASGTYSPSAPNTPVDLEVIRGAGVTTVKVNGVVVINNVAQAALSGGGKIGVFASWATSKYDNVDVAAGAPEIEVEGNSVVVADGDTTPSTTDYTDFGSAGVTGATVTKTYTIRNTGTAALTVSTVTAGGDFAITAQPPSSIAAGGSGTFSVRFDPSATGVRTAAVSFINGDAN